MTTSLLASSEQPSGEPPGSRVPRVANYPAYSVTAAGEVIDLMAQLKRPLDPWQQWILRRGLGQNRNPETDRLEFAADQCGCWVPRQNGKGDIIMALEIGWLFVYKIPLIIHSAHLYPTAQEGFLKIEMLADANRALLGKHIKAVKRANGEQGFETNFGSRLRFMARQGGAGLGFSAPKLILDEAQALTEDLMQTVLPVLSAQDDPQIWFFGTPPRTDDAWIYNLKEAGENGEDGVAWFNYGIETLDLSDRANMSILRDPRTWTAANPSLGIIRGNGTGLRERAVRGELRTLGAGQAFAMDRCGMWLPRARKEGDSSIDPSVWAARATTRVKISELGDIAVSFHVNARRTHATIGFAAMREGMWYVGIIAHKPGTGWLLEMLRDIKEKYRPVAFTTDTKGETTLDDLAAIGIRLPEVAEEPKRGDLILPVVSDIGTAFGMIVDAANNDNIRHEDAAPLNSAVSVPPRPAGTSASTFDHKRGIEVGPAKTTSEAMWAYRERIEKIKDDYDPLANIW